MAGSGYVVVQSDEDIDEVMNAASQAEEEGTSSYRGKTYEEGVLAMGQWMSGLSADPPLP